MKYGLTLVDTRKPVAIERLLSERRFKLHAELLAVGIGEVEPAGRRGRRSPPDLPAGLASGPAPAGGYTVRLERPASSPLRLMFPLPRWPLWPAMLLAR